MALLLPRELRRSLFVTSTVTPNLKASGFRSDAALEAIAKAREEEKMRTPVLYNCPSFSGAFSALFAELFHSYLNRPCLILPFSSIHPLRVIVSDHRKLVLSKISSTNKCQENVTFHVDTKKSSSTAVYDYFSN